MSQPLKLFISTLFFGFGWFSLSFTLPLLAQDIGYSYVIIGVLGFMAALPFPIVAYLYTRADSSMLKLGTIIPLVTLTVISVFFYLFYRPYFIPLTIIASLAQAPWWISTEISIGTIGGVRNAEKYSAGWGIPNAIAPILMGVVLQATGYELVFLISMVAFICALLFSPRPGKLEDGKGKVTIRKKYLLSLFFSGLFSGFIYFVMEPVLKAHNFGYVLIGGIASLYGLIAAIGYVILNYTRDYRISSYSAVSALLIFPTALLGLYLNVYTVLTAVILAGFGVSISMSKVLSYIAASSDIRRGVFYYETFFGIGFMCGSLLQDVLYQFFGKFTIFLMFLGPLVYGVYLVIYRQD